MARGVPVGRAVTSRCGSSAKMAGKICRGLIFAGIFRACERCRGHVLHARRLTHTAINLIGGRGYTQNNEHMKMSDRHYGLECRIEWCVLIYILKYIANGMLMKDAVVLAGGYKK